MGGGLWKRLCVVVCGRYGLWSIAGLSVNETVSETDGVWVEFVCLRNHSVSQLVNECFNHQANLPVNQSMSSSFND